MNYHLLFCQTDKNGAKLNCSENGRLTIKLPHEIRPRNIGEILPYDEKRDKLVYLKKEEEKQVFRKTDSWSIPYEIVKNVDYICFITELYVYKITSEKALEVGDFLWFKDSGVERKIYVPRENWWKGEIKK